LRVETPPKCVYIISYGTHASLISLLQIRALILENTFMSLPRLIPSALPFLSPVSFLCHQKWDSASKLPLIPKETPILMLSGVRDEIVPREHMQALWEIVVAREEKGMPITSRYEEFPRGMHSEWLCPGFVIAIALPSGAAVVHR
jgi:hypothetical protein